MALKAASSLRGSSGLRRPTRRKVGLRPAGQGGDLLVVRRTEGSL